MVDGCNSWRVLWTVLVPAVKPGLITVGLFAFLAAWNDFFAVDPHQRHQPDDAAPRDLEPARPGAGRRRLQGHRGGRRRARPAVHPPLPDPPTSLRARLHVGRLQGMNMTRSATTTTTHLVPVAPSSGALRPLGLDEVTITGGFWHHRQEVNGTATLAHIGAGSSARMARQLRPRGIRSAARGPSRSRVLGLRGVQVPRGRGLGDRPARRRRARGAVPPHRGPRGGSAGGRRLPEHAVRATGSRARWSDLEWGHELYCLGHLFQAAVARARRTSASPTTDWSGSHAAPPISCARSSARAARAHLRSRRGRGGPRGARTCAGGSRGTSSRRGCSSSGTVGGPCATSSGAARTTRTTSPCATPTRCADTRCARTPLRRRDGRRGRDGRRRAAPRARRAVGRDRRAAHVRHRRPGARTTRTRRSATTGAARRSGLLRDVCGRGIRDVQLAPAAREGRPPLRRPDRAHALQRGGDLAERVGHRVLLCEHPAPAPARLRGRCRPGVAARPLVAARAVVRRVVLPPNTARTFASLAAYVATADDSGIQLHQYAPSSIRTRLADGQEVALEVSTAYPREGAVLVRVLTDAASPWTLSLRVPSWASGAQVVVRPASGGQVLDADPHGRASAVSIERAFSAGDEVELELPVPPRFTRADSQVDAVRGCLVVERGPEVFALESVDLAGAARGIRLRRPARGLGAGTRRRRRGRGDRRRAPGRDPTHSCGTTSGPSAVRRGCGCRCRSSGADASAGLGAGHPAEDRSQDR